MRRLFVCLAVPLAVACGPKRVAVDPAIAGRATLAQADANVRAGCFDCLVEALAQYESARSIPALADQAASGAFRAAAILAIRERELGTTDSGYLEKARRLAPPGAEVAGPLLEVVELFPWRGGTGPGAPGRNELGIFANREQRIESLRALAGRDELSAYVIRDVATFVTLHHSERLNPLAGKEAARFGGGQRVVCRPIVPLG
jgi:hypothetical protein